MDAILVIKALTAFLITVALLYVLYKICGKFFSRIFPFIARSINYNKSKAFTNSIIITVLMVSSLYCYLNWSDIKDDYFGQKQKYFDILKQKFTVCMVDKSALTNNQLSCAKMVLEFSPDPPSEIYRKVEGKNECIFASVENCEIKKLLVKGLDCEDHSNIIISDVERKAYMSAIVQCYAELGENHTNLKLKLLEKLDLLLNFIIFVFLYFIIPLLIAHFLFWYLFKWVRDGKLS